MSRQGEVLTSLKSIGVFDVIEPGFNCKDSSLKTESRKSEFTCLCIYSGHIFKYVKIFICIKGRSQMQKHNVYLKQKRGDKPLESNQKLLNCLYIFIIAI